MAVVWRRVPRYRRRVQHCRKRREPMGRSLSDPHPSEQVRRSQNTRSRAHAISNYNLREYWRSCSSPTRTITSNADLVQSQWWLENRKSKVVGHEVPARLTQGTRKMRGFNQEKTYRILNQPTAHRKRKSSCIKPFTLDH